MGIYLKENEIGFDVKKVGFPGLGSCMGIVLQTDHGLFGFHSFGNANPKGGTFEYKRDSTSSQVSIRFADSDAVTTTSQEGVATPVRVIRPNNEVATPYKSKVVASAKPKAGGAGFANVGDDGFYSIRLP